MKTYKVTLTAEERNSLQELIAAGKASAQKLAHARILLKADASPDGPAWPDARIAEAVEVNVTTVERVRERLLSGFDWDFLAPEEAPASEDELAAAWADLEAELTAEHVAEAGLFRRCWAWWAMIPSCSPSSRRCGPS